MKKYMLDLRVSEKRVLGEQHVLLKARTADGFLPDMTPGQFAQLRVDHSPQTFLRRPISIHFADSATGEISFLIQAIGQGTAHLAALTVGDTLNAILPLGTGFTIAEHIQNPLLVGGGVGIAPLLFLGERLAARGIRPTFLMGGRSAKHLLLLNDFARYGEVYTTTEDGSAGEKGFVTAHSILRMPFDFVYTCGPKPMMMAVARYARASDTPCEVSLENTMACGVGACLCCVENTNKGNVCACTEGPVFPVNRLLWQI